MDNVSYPKNNLGKMKKHVLSVLDELWGLFEFAPLRNNPSFCNRTSEKMMRHVKRKRCCGIDPWRREAEVKLSGNQVCLNSFEEKFDSLTLSNMGLNNDIKRAALKVAPSVVSLVSHSDGKLIFEGSGIIIDCVEDSGTYSSTILSSATLLRSSTESHALASDVKINVRISSGRFFDGHIFAYDFHFNVASIKINSSTPLPVAILCPFNDSISIDPRNIQSLQLRPHSDAFKLSPGDLVVAIGRFHRSPYELMAASGRFSLADCKFKCGELFVADCKISKCGIGGPLVNSFGEVIGLNFYRQACTPFLPINIVSKCLDHFDKYQKFCRPWIGVKLTNLYAASLDKLERVIQKFPQTFDGVLVEQVVAGSPGDKAGILAGDVLIQCAGTTIHSFLQFMEVIMDNIGKSVSIVVLREASGECYTLALHVHDRSQKRFYSWPVPPKYWTRTSFR